MSETIVLFEDRRTTGMAPINLTRPGFLTCCAGFTLYEIGCLTGAEINCIVRPYLRKLTERLVPRNENIHSPCLFLNANIAPDVRYISRFCELLENKKPFICTAGQRIAAALVPGDVEIPANLDPDGIESFLLELGLPLNNEIELRLFDYPYHIVDALHDLFPGNIRRKIENGSYDEIKQGVFAAGDVDIASSAVFRTEDGPIVLEAGVKVMDFTILSGPIMIGADTRIIERSTVKELTSIGKTCKIGGEVEASIIEDFTNKQHHGFLGHSYVGSWVNLGAGTSNSDLKNTYGEIRIQHLGRKMDTQMQFFGCIIGDFSKTAINTSIFTGKIIGVNSMLYGYVGQNVASFCNYASSFGQVTECTLEQAISTQGRMFARRDRKQTQEDISLLTDVYNITTEERRFSTEPPVL